MPDLELPLACDIYTIFCIFCFKKLGFHKLSQLLYILFQIIFSIELYQNHKNCNNLCNEILIFFNFVENLL